MALLPALAQLMCRRRSTFFLTSVGLAVAVLPYVSPLSFGSSLARGLSLVLEATSGPQWAVPGFAVIN